MRRSWKVRRAVRRTIGGSWGAYWYNGYVYSSEMARGLDILEMVPNEHLSANEIAAAKLVMMDEFNPQSQPLITWPAAFPVVRSYVDQLERNGGLPAARTTAIAADGARCREGAGHGAGHPRPGGGDHALSPVRARRHRAGPVADTVAQ
jgi:hypothetical protein